jgi:hypothetical protein
MNARAAIERAVEMGVTDPDQVVTEPSMTANLLFRVGIARSGAYNRTLTPFGFQNERRTLWGSARSLRHDVALNERAQDHHSR